MLPFVSAHLYLFFTMAWPVALAAVLLAVVLSFPFAWLFELGGRTLWGPAILHFVIQGAVKVIVVGDERFAMFWMAGCLLIPLLSFLVRPQSGGALQGVR
jgi:hypothetical protein